MPTGVYERTPEMKTGKHERTPEMNAANSKAITGVPKSPEHRAAMSAARINSAAVKAANDVKRGGQDLVNHHYLYDHADLSLNTVQMTRSDHQKLHRLLQKLGYIVPHINIAKR